MNRILEVDVNYNEKTNMVESRMVTSGTIGNIVIGAGDAVGMIVNQLAKDTVSGKSAGKYLDEIIEQARIYMNSHQ